MRQACYMFTFQGDREMRSVCPKCAREVWINRDALRMIGADWVGICPHCQQRCTCVEDRHVSAELAVFEEAAWAAVTDASTR